MVLYNVIAVCSYMSFCLSFLCQIPFHVNGMTFWNPTARAHNKRSAYMIFPFLAIHFFIMMVIMIMCGCYKGKRNHL